MRAASDALGSWLLTILSDFWRLGVGPLQADRIIETVKKTEAKVLDALSNQCKDQAAMNVRGSEGRAPTFINLWRSGPSAE